MHAAPTGRNHRLQANIYPTHEPGIAMNRALLPLALIAVLAACPTYDEYPKLSDQRGLVDADTYARTLPDVVNIQADSLGHRMTIQFKSGWRTMVNPINDGKRGGETPNLPGAPQPRQ